MLESPPSWASRDRGNIRAPSGFTWGERVGVQESRGLKWRNWPRCSGWDDVICLPARGEEEWGTPGRRERLPTEGKLRCCALRGEPAPGLGGPFGTPSRRALYRGGRSPPSRQNWTTGAQNWRVVKPSPTDAASSCLFIRLPSLSPISLISTSCFLFFFVVKYSSSCLTIICVS